MLAPSHGAPPDPLGEGDAAARPLTLRPARRDEADALSALSPGEPSKSELLARIHTEDVAQQMPPPGKAKPLSDDEKAKLRAWIAAGAPYQQHWAYVKPRRSPVPAA